MRPLPFLAALPLLLALLPAPGAEGGGGVPARRLTVRPALAPSARDGAEGGATAPLTEAARRRIERRRAFPHELFAPGATPRPPKPLAEILAGDGVLASAQEPAPDTLRVALFRVDFLADTHADSSTGDGRFDLRRGVVQPVDPPPHDRAYFAAHAEALARYYAVQSYGGLVVLTTILPAGEEAAFHLGDTGNYGPWAVEQSEEVIRNAEEFVTDAIRGVDATGTVDFGDFDAYVVVHAGSDHQSDIENDTPADIPTFTLNLGEPLAVTGGSVSRVLVLPESVIQDGALGALNGVFAHEFGHILGLPDLYNIFNGVPQVGFWSLMDSGENIPAIIYDPETDTEFEAYGVFPTSLDPWCKLQVFSGFVSARAAGEDYGAPIEAVQVNRSLPLVAIDPLEYFLVENRAYDLDGNGLPYVQQDSLTGVFLGPVDDPDRPGQGGRTEYDSVLPGSGVLIWHIDDRIVIPALADRGQVNLYTGYRGIAVEEADGIWDQGRLNFGVPNDPFFDGNNTRFAPDTVPSSEANDGSWTGITIEIAGTPSRYMGLHVERSLARDGVWPVWLREETRLGSLAITNLDGTGDGEILFAFESPDAGAGALKAGVGALRGDGTQFFFDGENGQATAGVGFQGGTRRYLGLALREGFFAEGDGAAPLLASVNQSGTLYLWKLTSDSLDTVPAKEIAAGARTAPVILGAGAGDGRILVARNGRVSTYDVDGALHYDAPSLAAAGSLPTAGPALLGPDAGAPVGVAWQGGWVELHRPLDAGAPAPRGRRLGSDVLRLIAGAILPGGGEGFAAATADSIVLLDGALSVVSAWPLPASDGAVVHVAPGDVDRDGVAETVATLAGGLVTAWNPDGSVAVGWPRVIDGPPRDLKLADLDANGSLDVLVLDGPGVLRGWSGGGKPLPTWPRPFGPFEILETWIETLDEEGLSYVAATGEAALVAVRLRGAAPVDGDWRYPDGRPERGGRSAARGAVTGPGPDLDGRPLLVYPNPARGADVEIRFALEPDERAEIEIYDVRGTRMDAARLDLRGGPRAGENAAVWDVDGLAPGLYLCRLRRSGGGGSRVDFARVAVLR